MARPVGLLRAGFPYLKTLGMRRITNFPYDVAFGKDDVIYVLLRTLGWLRLEYGHLMMQNN